MRPELEAIELALVSARVYFERNMEANAVLHPGAKLLESPVLGQIDEALESLNRLRDENCGE